MKVRSLGWLGVRTASAAAMCDFCRDVLKLELLPNPSSGTRFELSDGTEIHVYGPDDTDHEFFGTSPVVGLMVESFASAHAHMTERGVEFLYPDPQRHGGKAWHHFRAADGNVYEIIGPDDLGSPERDRVRATVQTKDATLAAEIGLIDGWANREAREFFRNVWPMYVHEISGYDTEFYRLDSTGRWIPNLVDDWISNATRPANLRTSHGESDLLQPFQRAHVVTAGGVPIGFACVGLQPFKYMPEDADVTIAEFFLAHKSRGTGAGRRAIELLVKQYPGRWHLRAIHDNRRAIRFWRKTLPFVGALDVRERSMDGDIVWEFTAGG